MLTQLPDGQWVNPHNILAVYSRGNPEQPDGFEPEVVVQWQFIGGTAVIRCYDYQTAVRIRDEIAEMINTK